MKQLPSLRLIETKPKKKLRKNDPGRSANPTVADEADSVLPELKNATTMLYLALESLRGSLDRPAACAKNIEDLKSLTCRIHALMEKLLETLP